MTTTVLDRFRLHPAPIDGVFDGMGGQAHRRRDVEAASSRLGQSGAGIGNEHCFTGHLGLRLFDFVGTGTVIRKHLSVPWAAPRTVLLR